ncbi:DUF1839 family protein [Lichenihabitans sp. Uapishka_5]|uniref:DUF1839 family protein n=1 Tax=Lichenihabitans sp. Uapishka_5 TaxID=3037302 RepID=UPI0029E81FAA|nr:DUF1839 family protein [Lichenihabitans sp. Uapishka_5]MDX7953730.1 DUF1839 family protein [Lichenihabitans sp. Uapishka_5]
MPAVPEPAAPRPLAPAVFPGLDPATHRCHALHGPERAWPDTNCYVDLLVEVLAARGFEPRAALGFTLAQDYEGDHFTFFKMPAADLVRLYGLEILELALYDDLEAHLATQVRRGRLPLVELDSFHLPDTRGVSYGRSHAKTTVGVNRIDPEARRLDYFHNAGLFRLEGDDYDALLKPYRPGDLPLLPYAEIIKFDVGPPAADPVATARVLLAEHLARRPRRNPFRAWADELGRDTEALARRPEAYFHAYAFNVLRQFGANFGCLQAHLAWLSEAGETGLAPAEAAADAIAQEAKLLQFQLARAAARNKVAEVGTAVERLAVHHDALMATLLQHDGPAADRRLAA